MKPLKFCVGDTVFMKKKHPCGTERFTVLRVGSDIRIACQGCKRDLTLEREALEKMIKKVVSENSLKETQE